jgi:tetratricopeptide (TPR) repeat protein
MKQYFLFILFSLLFCSCSSSNSQSTRKQQAIDKQINAVNMFMNARYANFNQDSICLAIALIDESIALDSTYAWGYLTKSRFLKEQGLYEESLDVINLAFRLHLENDKPILFLYRGILYEKLHKKELAQADYQAAIPLYDQYIEQNPNNYDALNTRILLLFLLNGKEEGLRYYAELLETQKLKKSEQQEVKQFISRLKNESRDEIIDSFN